MNNLDLINKITASTGVLGLICAVVAFISYKLFLSEREDRRKAWSYYGDMLKKYNELLIKNTVVLEGINKTLEDLNDNHKQK